MSSRCCCARAVPATIIHVTNAAHSDALKNAVRFVPCVEPGSIVRKALFIALSMACSSIFRIKKLPAGCCMKVALPADAAGIRDT